MSTDFMLKSLEEHEFLLSNAAKYKIKNRNASISGFTIVINFPNSNIV